MKDNNATDITKRAFLKNVMIGTAALTAVKYFAIPPFLNAAPIDESLFLTPKLPYPENALEPSISERTLHIHFNEHHRFFAEQVKSRIKGTALEKSSLKQIINATKNSINMEETLHMMAILSWNHTFYWQSMKPSGAPISPSFEKIIKDSFGDISNCKNDFIKKGMQPGSGWVWLVAEGTKLKWLYSTYHNTPLLSNPNQKLLLTIDCWEHAYYLDYQNRKADYLNNFFEKLADWSFAESNFNSTQSKG